MKCTEGSNEYTFIKPVLWNSTRAAWNLTFPKWQKTSIETYDTSSKAKQVQSLLNFINVIDVPALYYNPRIWCLVTLLIAGYLSIESHIKSVEKFIVSQLHYSKGQLGAVSLTPMFFRTKIWIQRLRVIPRHRLQHDRTIFYTKLIPRTSCTMSCSEDTCCPLSLIFAVLLTGILQGVERPGSVYSNMPQRWHRMVLQYVAASFHLPSVSIANINTVQYTKPYQQYKTPTIPAVVISKVLLPQSNIMTAIVQSNSRHFFDVSSGLPT